MVQNMSDSNATPSVRGWDFQINAAIYMFLLDTKNTKTINVESKTEDIEIENSSGSISFLQAKSCFNPNEDNRKWGENLKKSLATLSKAYEYNRDESFKMIFNYSDVFGKRKVRSFGGNSVQILKFDELRDEERKSILKKAPKDYKNDKSFFDKLTFIFIPFHGSDENTRHRIIKEKLDEFLGTLKLTTGSISRDYLYFLNYKSFANSSNGGRVSLLKEDLVWPLVAIVINNLNQHVEELEMFHLFPEELDELKVKYENFINQKENQFSYVTKVVASFDEFIRINDVTPRNSVITFVNSSVDVFLNEFELKIENLGDLIKIINYSILKKKRFISAIKEETGMN